MLTITIPKTDLWDEQNEIFIPIPEQTLTLEHSLESLSKWESKWHKPFLTQEPKTREESIDYIKCMTLNENVDPNVYIYMSDENLKKIEAYMEDSMTATWFSDDKKNKQSRQQITNELIYYWMVALNIPFECEKWHLNRLMTFIKVCNAENQPKHKMSMNERRALNEARRNKSKIKR